jgi:hypothetical protein
MKTAKSVKIVAALLLLSCGEDEGFSPSLESVAGVYHATSLTATQNGIDANLLALGTTLSLVLNSDGTLSGRLFAPGGDEDGSDLDVDLNGTWQLSGSRVTFTTPGADTFVDSMTFTVEPNRLVGDESFGQTRLRVVLTRVEEETL